MRQETMSDLFGFGASNQSRGALTSRLGWLKDTTKSRSSVDGRASSEESVGPQAPGVKPPQKMGTVLGVFVPCVQNILGVILFLRLSNIVAWLGIQYTLVCVGLCCATTFLTSLSLSAIATNGAIKGGGPYYLISRALGPEFGGSVGLCFYLGTTVASSMYILGAAEMLLVGFPDLTICGIEDDTCVGTDCTLNMRIYGYIVLLLCSACVFAGVKYISVVSPFFLIPVILSVLCMWIGFFVASLRNIEGCVPEPQCSSVNESGSGYGCSTLEGISGISEDNIDNNWDRPPNGQYNNDGEYDFRYCLALFFPSVTGIMAGSNRSGDLRDAQRSIPIGTLCATLSTSALYLLTAFMYGATVDRATLANDDYVLSAKISWPAEEIVQVGIVLSTLGAALQSLTGAPRLLQAIANDNLIPALSIFRGKGEPRRALLCTVAISAVCIAGGDLNVVAPFVTMFFLLCYMFVNLACLLQDLLKEPNWRPRFHLYHPVTAGLGLGLCVFIMFYSDYTTNGGIAAGSIFVVLLLYAYIQYRKVEAQWGDGMRGLRYQRARSALEQLEKLKDGPHIKNWRPQVLLFCKTRGESCELTRPRMLALLSQLKGGRGLCILGSIVEGRLATDVAKRTQCENNLRAQRDAAKVKGFSQVVMCPDVTPGLGSLIQTAGLGALAPNTAMIAWSTSWRDDPDKPHRMCLLLQRVQAYNMATIVVCGTDNIPDHHARVHAPIDIWWVVHDGGLQLLLTTILRKNRVWTNCPLRVFCVLQQGENPIELQKTIEGFVYSMRIDAEVQCVVLKDEDSASFASTPRGGRAADWQVNAAIVQQPIGHMMRGTAVADDVIDEHRQTRRKNAAPAAREHMPSSKRPVEVAGSSLLADADDKASARRARRKSLEANLEATQTLRSTRILNRLFCQYSSESALVMTNLPPPVLHDEYTPKLYMEQVDTLIEDLPLCLLVAGQRNADVVTMYS